MKKNFLFAMAMAAVFAGCSSDDDPVTNAGGEVTGEGYIALSINLPTQNTTRAFDENNNLNDGMPSEYAVKNAYAIIFDGTTNNYKTTLTLSTHPWTNNDDVPNHITTTSSVIVTETNGQVAAGDNVLIVLNTFTGFPTFSTTDNYETVSQTILTESAVEDGYILMTNAPLVDKTPASSTFDGKISVLVNIPSVYSTAAEAQAAADKPQIYVERAVAKVTMKQATSDKLSGVANDANISWQVAGWLLNNTNSKSYLVRQTSTDNIQKWGALLSTNATASANGYRFVGNTQVGTSGMYRTYFAEDVNYSTTTEPLNQVTSSAILSTVYGDENPQYCYENTFDVENQINKQTTHVIIKAVLNNGEDLYIVDGSKINVYKKESLIAYLLSEMGVSETVLKTYIESGSKITNNDFELTLTEVSGKESVYTVTNITPNIDLSTTGSKYTATGHADLTTLLSNNLTKVNSKEITKYKDGVSYYAARIKHFGDDFTPWNNDETPGPSATNGVYPTDKRDENYLGRYGVLRNNWYDLNVTSIATVGEVSIEAVNNEENDDDPDDELESYITLQINILSWAKRTQGVEL